VNERALSAVVDVLATTPGVMFCVKGLDGTYLHANQAFAERAGLSGPGEVVGCTARDLFPADLAQQYEAQDDAVLATGRPLTNELELITRPDRSYGWFVTSKSRWTDDDGAPVGMVSVSVDLRTPADAAARHEQLALAVEYARANHSSPIAVATLAEVADMSVSQLERAARRILGLTPKQLIIRFRIEAALSLLETGAMPIAEVATQCGYYDQSAFSRHFRRTVGTSPAEHRSRFTTRR